MSEQLNEAADRIHNDLLAEQGKIIEQQRATIEDLKRQLANADSILDEQIKMRDATIEALQAKVKELEVKTTYDSMVIKGLRRELSRYPDHVYGQSALD